MLRIALGVIAGYVAWTILWVGSDQVLIQTVGWYGDHQHAFERAMFNKEAFEPSMTVLAFHIIRSVIVSFISGFVAALVANETRRTALILGVLLLISGIAVEVMAWHYLPIWYHLIFLLLLIPVTIAGGKARTIMRTVQNA
ncbi:MAG: hypothetical protein ABJA02_13575 [Acidobacteriota bacterium]